MRGYVQCEVFGLPFGRHWGHFGPHRMGFKQVMFGPFGHGPRHFGPPGCNGFWHHGPSGHHGHHGHNKPNCHGPDHSPDRCGRRSPPPGPSGHHGLDHHGPDSSPERCGRRSPGRHGPPKHGARGGPDSSPERCGRRSSRHHRFPGHQGPHGHGHHSPDRADGTGQDCSSGPWRHRRHGRHLRQECGCGLRSRCKPYKGPGRCCGRPEDAKESGNETCDRGTLTDIFPNKAVVIERVVLEKASRCYSV
ncbi:hypothetical protein O3G_MSEX005542 [Manduca sexta]|uniref:Uncharacterized protein n=1 Tax=Manduca sexta TaxID=7130 RepID=A0A922CJR0_MANSE|nr:hypothetical protein O3G_MSEX005542 [Manduca sexta]KAG6448459.1 hypothetical protein O3G_MSEX005542 [Manduca sexta]KAG6448460.1 hypothetical protein O3G_MSEX005542 [Manduca sexta]